MRKSHSPSLLSAFLHLEHPFRIWLLPAHKQYWWCVYLKLWRTIKFPSTSSRAVYTFTSVWQSNWCRLSLQSWDLQADLCLDIQLYIYVGLLWCSCKIVISCWAVFFVYLFAIFQIFIHCWSNDISEMKLAVRGIYADWGIEDSMIYIRYFVILIYQIPFNTKKRLTSSVVV